MNNARRYAIEYARVLILKARVRETAQQTAVGWHVLAQRRVAYRAAYVSGVKDDEPYS